MPNIQSENYIAIKIIFHCLNLGKSFSAFNTNFQMIDSTVTHYVENGVLMMGF